MAERATTIVTAVGRDLPDDPRQHLGPAKVDPHHDRLARVHRLLLHRLSSTAALPRAISVMLTACVSTVKAVQDPPDRWIGQS